MDRTGVETILFTMKEVIFLKMGSIAACLCSDGIDGAEDYFMIQEKWGNGRNRVPEQAGGDGFSGQLVFGLRIQTPIQPGGLSPPRCILDSSLRSPSSFLKSGSA